VLRHRFITLMVMFGTIGLTGYLYVVIPKGFFPQQDTGMIIAIAEAGQNISYPAMEKEMEAVLGSSLKILRWPRSARRSAPPAPRRSTTAVCSSP